MFHSVRPYITHIGNEIHSRIVWLALLNCWIAYLPPNHLLVALNSAIRLAEGLNEHKGAVLNACELTYITRDLMLD